MAQMDRVRVWAEDTQIAARIDGARGDTAFPQCVNRAVHGEALCDAAEIE